MTPKTIILSAFLSTAIWAQAPFADLTTSTSTTSSIVDSTTIAYLAIGISATIFGAYRRGKN